MGLVKKYVPSIPYAVLTDLYHTVTPNWSARVYVSVWLKPDSFPESSTSACPLLSSPSSRHVDAHPSLSLWYPRHMLQYRVGVFFGGATLAGAFSGLLAFGISFMSGTAGLLGWSWIFVSSLAHIPLSMVTVTDSGLVQIIEGMLTVVVGAISFFSECLALRVRARS